MRFRRIFVPAVVAAGSFLGFGGAMAAPAEALEWDASVAAELNRWGPVIGECSSQTGLQKRFLGYLGPFVGVACNDTREYEWPWGPDCMLYVEMADDATCHEYPLPGLA